MNVASLQGKHSIQCSLRSNFSVNRRYLVSRPFNRSRPSTGIFRCKPATTNEGDVSGDDPAVIQGLESKTEEEVKIAPEETKSFLPFWTMFGLSSAGFLETAYLTAVRFSDAPLACPTSGCAPVLQSGYSSLFGIPLTVLGMLGYGAVALLSLKGATGSDYEKDGSTKDIVFFSTIALASCSSVLMYILFTKLGGESCLWCYSSAALSFTLLILCLRSYRWGTKWNEFPMAFMPGGTVAATTVAALLIGFQNVEVSIAQDIDLPYQLPTVTESSERKAVQLAKRLSDSGVKMFGAFWCNHCYDQKQLFGKEAMEYFPYVECYPEGYRKGVTIADVCEKADIHAFPTWVFGNDRIEGDQELDDLDAALKEYTDFGKK
ncbi:hypothetical protein BSKO_08922 [Bryopsis sp. KO-2023]|nr:hypothetical protein BSKO_08922 [Bryopsis sp. KO-2023]